MVSDIATVPELLKLEVHASKAEYAKIRLVFLTDEPKHVRSQMLHSLYGSKPPFVEDVCILMPRMRVFSILEAFIPAFEKLQEANILPPTAKLLGFKVLDEDSSTLAYLFN